VYGESTSNKAIQKRQNEVGREEKLRSQAALEVKLELWTGLAENNCALSSPPHDAKPAPLQDSRRSICSEESKNLIYPYISLFAKSLLGENC
jgi:hypothetical protein